ncbi:hypothetical protein CHS0354_002007 [Potamilus streckersoni]|uniref:Glutamine synthetase n=1 Tax=Potamilus streckersoni TaxID=2493646 RepID=A0AAE0W7Q8_9BIVA|nr:hypothetical protein CHS0354_002007 [Potamilus streckersoni]
MSSIRKDLITRIAEHKDRQKNVSKTDVQAIFGSMVFDDRVMRSKLPKDAYKALKQTIIERKELNGDIADIVAAGMKDWAVENGATHYTHWFQPMTGSTAEKHDAFVTVTGDGHLIMSFSGKELIKGEPDASSFPSGGIRATFEARGYTAWDPTSPAFIKQTQHGSTLFIPTAFCSYTGESLDLKTPLLRSQEVLSKKAVELLHLLGEKNVKRVHTTAGIEQEYFLIDKYFYYQRPDLVASGRTLFGKSPFKGQELEDHYFGAIRPRVLNFMMDAEKELYKLGIPIRTRHNEVAPAQYEIAPFFEDANIAVDHNLLIMDTMNRIADEHGFKILFHEKPFAGINGSGKHCNWSMADSEGNNLLDPGDTPHQNMNFMVFLSAVIRAVDKHAKLLRAAVAHSGNDHRLGANEAPPAIISIFLGDELEAVVNNITAGASQSASAPNYFLNAAVSEAIEHITGELKKLLQQGTDLQKAVQTVVKDVLTAHKRVIFNGNGYSQEWQDEAARRGLPNLRNTVDVIKEFGSAEQVALLEGYGILSKAEIQSRKIVRLEKYIKYLEVEMRACLEIVSTQIIPTVIKYQYSLAQTAEKVKQVLGDDNSPEVNQLRRVTELLRNLISSKNELEKTEANTPHGDEVVHAEYIRDKVVPAMLKIREYTDALEGIVDDSIWPLPKYREMLTII